MHTLNYKFVVHSRSHKMHAMCCHSMLKTPVCSVELALIEEILQLVLCNIQYNVTVCTKSSVDPSHFIVELEQCMALV